MCFFKVLRHSITAIKQTFEEKKNNKKKTTTSIQIIEETIWNIVLT
jgi:hypothetical protein